MFDVDVSGLAELEGGKPPHRLAVEPIANVFDEFRGYGEERRKPSFCDVTIVHSPNPRGILLTVRDDGPGFSSEKDIWTFFGSTSKRSDSGVAGRFNSGDKQLLALSRRAVVKTNCVTVTFENGKRDVVRHREPVVAGTIFEVLLPWTRDDERLVRQKLGDILPPEGLQFTIDGATIKRPAAKCLVNAQLPTVILSEGALRTTVRKTSVSVLPSGSEAMLYELGIPVCSLAEIGFPWSLDVGQKVPVPMSRDVVQPSYLFRLIGNVLEQSALDGHNLLTEEQQGAGFIRDSLEWVRDPVALEETVKAVYGNNVVRQSSDPTANAKAAEAGATIIPGRWFGSETRGRMNNARIAPTAHERFGGSETIQPHPDVALSCPKCGHRIQ